MASQKVDTHQKNSPKSKLGVWIIGGRGAVSSSVILGTCAIRKGLIDNTGLVTKMQPFSQLPLAEIESMVFGGHDPGNHTIVDSARSLGREAIDPRIIDSLSEELDAINRNILVPPARKDGDSPLTFVKQVQDDILKFKHTHQLENLVVVNLSSTEPVIVPHSAHQSLPEFRTALSLSSSSLPGFSASATLKPLEEAQLPVSVLYAYAALDAGFPYVNFTPSTGANLPALEQLAAEKKVPFAGSDGKTGETLLKTALAPMFAQRALKIQSWVGYNILGNGDGKSLSDPSNAKSKLQTKGAVLPGILGYEPFSHVAIDYVPSIGDWKTAVDLVQFEGFFNTPMTFSFTWRGCDSMLAAPLILDLVRLTQLAHERKETGALAHLAFFFKSPLACNIHDLSKQYELLTSHVMNGEKSSAPRLNTV